VSPVKSSAAVVYGAVFCIGFGLLCTIWTVVTLKRGEYLTAIVVLGFAGFCFGLIVPFIIIKTGRVTPRGAFDAAGTTIQPDRRVEVLSLLWGLVTVAAMGLFAILFPLGKLDIPVPHTMRFYIPFLGAAGAVMGAPTLWRRVRRGRGTYLRLTADGFEFSKGLSSRHIEWEQVKDVTDKVPGQATPADSAVVILRTDGDAMTLAAGSFTPNGRALRQWVRFYWQHPDHRGELTDRRALERLRNEDFEVSR
jgi:hypothetical protein